MSAFGGKADIEQLSLILEPPLMAVSTLTKRLCKCLKNLTVGPPKADID
jgi:hypothetical protein